MASLVHGFDYDIFISYRHNDNLNGWVSDFVQNLERELKSTIKEPLSIYFDKNLHDGLGENHVVDKSLEGKLCCVIFIPILSQTYCDSKSFAWQHEFVAFNSLAENDALGIDVKIANGNVASRILPVRIHHLDPDDVAALERETGSPLRAIEFIFSAPGVNRPLTPFDKREENQNKTVFRDQVNKTANAVKEIIHAVTHKLPQLPNPVAVAATSPGRRWPTRNVILALILLAGFVVAVSLAFTRQKDELEPVDRSIAVLPFVNMSNDPEQEYFSDGISEEILNVLAKVSELKVIGRTSSFYFKGKNEDLRVIGEKLGVGHLLEGSVRRDGNIVRITAQLIRATDGSHLWSETYERKMENIFQLQDEIASKVLGQLKLKLLGNVGHTHTRSPEVQNLLLQGRYLFNNANFEQALDKYQQAVALDSTDAEIWTALAQTHSVVGNDRFKGFDYHFRLVKYCVSRALALDSSSSDAHRLNGAALFYYDLSWEAARRECKRAIQLDSNNSDAFRNLAQVERALGEFDIAIMHLKKSIELNPLNFLNYSNLATIYVAKEQYADAATYLSRASDINPDLVKPQRIYLYIFSGQLDKAEEEIRKLPLSFSESEKNIIRAMILFKRGKKSEALDLLKRSIAPERMGSFDVARAFAFMDQRDEAFSWLDKAYSEKFRIVSVKHSPFLAPLRDDPRYTMLLKKMNLSID